MVRAAVATLALAFFGPQNDEAPTMKVVATTTGVNRWALMALPNSKPITTAGKKAISTLSRKTLRLLAWAGHHRVANFLPVHQ
jgi:hypothetical protein